MISATWWATPWRRNTPLALRVGSSWMRHCPVSVPGMRSCEAPPCGISISAGRMSNGWVSGRERIYLDRFWNELSANPKAIDEATRRHYAALYARPRAMHDAFEQFGAFGQDGIDNKALLTAGKLSMPILAVGAEKSFGPDQADELRFVGSNVTGAIVPGSGHWIMEENPGATTTLVLEFLAK